MRQNYLIVCLLLLSPYVLRAHSGHGSLEFVENRGQWKEPFLYKAAGGYGDVYLEENGFTFRLGAAENGSKASDFKHGRISTPPRLRFHVYRMRFVGARKPEQVTAGKLQPHYYNYFLGNDPARWKGEIHPAYNVDYKSLYQDIDLHLSSENTNLKYDLIVRPGADVSQIKLNYEGAQLSVKDNNLLVETSVGTVTEMAPYAYQYLDGKRVEVPCKYKLHGNTVSFVFPKGYDETRTLIIDPDIIFATFSGSVADNFGFTATYDAQGNFYAGGISFDQGYPVTTGAYDVTYNGGGSGGGNPNAEYDISISKFNPSGTALVYSTYIGGSDNEQPHSMIVDGGGNLIIAGRAYSGNYPTQNAFDNSIGGGADIIVTKFNAAGTALVGSTFYGGVNDDGVNINSSWNTANNAALKHSYADDSRSEVIVDNAGNIYVASCTRSSGLTGISGTLAGGQDGLVLKFNSNLSSVIGGSYIGGTGEDAAYVLALNNAQTMLYVGGGTTATAFAGGITAGSYGPAYKGGVADGFIARFQNAGAPVLNRATYVGSSAYDQVFGIQLDDNDDVYAMGNTLAKGTDLLPNSTWFDANSPQFVIKLKNDLTGPPIFITRFGEPNANAVDISPVAFLIDSCQNIYVSGWGGQTAGNGGSTAAMTTDITSNPVRFNGAPSGIMTSTTDGSDFYFIVISKNAASLLFAGYYGGATLAEHVDGGTSRFDRNGVVYQSICGGCGGSSALATTPGAYSSTNNSSTPVANCNLAAIKIAFNLGAVSANIDIKPDKVVCLGEAANFQNNSSNGTSYEWDFGDGVGTSTQFVPNPYVYNKAGTFTIRMIVTNPDACKVKDTAYLTITVDTVKINADFEIEVNGSCSPYDIKIVNKSQFSKTPGSPGFTTFTWDFGDGKTGTGLNPVHTYADTGTYTIRMTMIDTTSCNSPDTVSRQVTFSNFNVKAGFEMPPVCERNKLVFNNTSTLAKTYFWDFGDGDISTDATPTHEYDTAGLYQVKLVAYNDLSCNKMDSITKTMEVRTSPIVDFDFSPKIITDEDVNKPTTFRNKTLGAETYNWNFGDNTGSEERDPIHFYKKTGTYMVCLMAKNQFDCWDTLCKQVLAEVEPIIDVPTGFSPNGDGKNDVFYVRGGAVEKVTLRVYNRWGELVFEAIDVQANDPAHGWDGTHKEKQQEMEAYAFVVNGSFIDGRTFYKKGNVTLIR